jgi:hypothetical protein
MEIPLFHSYKELEIPPPSPIFRDGNPPSSTNTTGIGNLPSYTSINSWESPFHTSGAGISSPIHAH